MCPLRILVCLIGFALVATGIAGADDQRAFLSLVVNMQKKGDVLTIVREGDLIVSVAALEAAGLSGFTGARESIEGAPWVSLRSLAPAVTYTFDEDGLALDMTANAALLGQHDYDLGTQHPPGIAYGTDAGAFLNYAITQSNRSPSAFLETAITNGKARLYLSGYSNPESSFGRGLQQLIWDDRAKLRTTTLGDAEVSAGDLGSNLTVTGFDIRRNFALDPYVVTYPTVGIAGLVSSPSTADIYVNGILIRRLDLPPGAYDLRNLPVPNGIGNARVVIRDAVGRETSVNQTFYQSARLLAKGETDYDYAAGFARTASLSTLDAEGSAALLARYQIGLTDALTVGARFERSRSLVNGGPIVDLRLPLGTLHVSAAASDQGGIGGTATSVGYSYSGRAFGFGIFQTALSANYARVNLPIAGDRALVDVLANATINVTRALSLSGNYERQKYRDSGIGSTMNVGAAYTMNRQFNLNVNASRSFGTTIAGRSDSVYATLTYAAGRSTTASASYQNVAGESTPILSVQHAVPVGNGVGFNADVSGGQVRSLTGTIIANVPFGQYTLDIGTASGSMFSTNLTLAGSLVTMGHGVFFGRPILDGFALVESAGSEQLTVQQENQDVATARGGAHVIVPNLTPNFANHLAAYDPKSPINSTLDRSEFVVAPAVQSGVRVRFVANTFRAYEGRVSVTAAAGPLAPAYGQLTLTGGGKSYRSDLGEDGEFYFEDLPPGVLAGIAQYREGECALTLNVTDAGGIKVDLGVVPCAPR